MANTNDTLSRTQSKPEKLAQWLFKQASNWRNVAAFLLIVGLTVISITFNVSLGMLSGVDETSKLLLPIGYALLDISALLLSAYAGFNCWQWLRQLIALAWLFLLVILSLWAAASFTLSVDARADSRELNHAIEQKQFEVSNLNALEKVWLENVEKADRFKSKHQNTLNDVQASRLNASNQLFELESSKLRPTMAIYELVGPWLGLLPDTLNTIVRLAWAAALTLSPFILTSVIFAGDSKNNDRNKHSTPPTPTGRKKWWFRFKDSALQKRKLKRLMKALEHQQKEPVMTCTSATQHNFADITT